MCKCYRPQATNHCRDWVDVSLCKFRSKLKEKEAHSSVSSSAGVEGQSVKGDILLRRALTVARLRLIRMTNKEYDDVFDEIESYLKEKYPEGCWAA